MYTIETQFTADDFKQGLRLHTRQAFPAIAFIPVLLGWHIFNTVKSGNITNIFYVQCFVGIAILYWFFIVLPKRSDRNSKENPYVVNKSTITVDQDSLSIQCLDDQKKINWSEISKWKESKTTLLIYPRENQFLTLPKRILHAEQIEEIYSLLNRKKKQL